MRAFALLFVLSAVSAWPGDFSTIGFKQVSQPFRLTSCKGLRSALCKTLANTENCDATQVVHFSKNATNRLSCDAKELAAKLILDKNDTDKDDSNKQRIELQVASGFSNAFAKPGESFIYRWWFYVPLDVRVARGKFFHNFQIKKRGTGEKQPMATFSLDTNAVGYHLRLCPLSSDCKNPKRLKLASLSEVKGKWIQAYVKVSFISSDVVITAMLANVAGGRVGNHVKDEKIKRVSLNSFL